MALAPREVELSFNDNKESLTSVGGVFAHIHANKFDPQFMNNAAQIVFAAPHLKNLSLDEQRAVLENINASMLEGREGFTETLGEKLQSQFPSMPPGQLQDINSGMYELLVTLDLANGQATDGDTSNLETITFERDFALEAAIKDAEVKAQAYGATSLHGNVPAYELEEIALAAGIPPEVLESSPKVLEAFANTLDDTLQDRGYKVDFEMTSLEMAYEAELEPKPEPEVKYASTPVPQYAQPDPNAIITPARPSMGIGMA